MKTFAWALVALIVLSSFKQEDTITVFMIGDSTMANKDYSKGRKERGWGMVLQCYFDDKVLIDNHAVNGRSSKSFIDEGRWDKVVENIEPGDYVIIQFGHNDEKPAPKRHTDPGTTFDENLRKFVRETREKGGIPILMNCVVRRNFFKQVPQNDDDEKLRNTTGATKPVTEEGDTLYDTHGDYRYSPLNVAKETNTVFINANQITHDLEQGLGREESKKLHMWFLPGEEPSIPDGRQDNTHYNVYGAHVVAKLLAEAIGDEVPELRKHLILGKYDIAVSRTGRGDYMTLSDAIAAAPEGEKTKIQLLGGEWTKPEIPEGKKIKFKLRLGAKWKE